MTENDPKNLFNISGQVAFMTGASGVLGGAVARGLAKAGVKMALGGRRKEALDALTDQIKSAGGEALPIILDVMNQNQLEEAQAKIKSEFGAVDCLLNFAGGNRPDATATPPERTFFSLPKEALAAAFELNILGTILPCQVFGKDMAEVGSGNIINISSMAADRPLTRVVSYSAAKAAVSNFTQWLAVHMAKEYNPTIRVNAVSPGFFLTDQNRYLLTDKETGKRTARGQSIIDSTPQDRYGDPEDLIGAVHWLMSPGAGFVTGTVIPVDGGFSAFSGV